MKRKTLKKTVMSLLAGGGAAAGATYDWTGGGANNRWDNHENWDCGAFCDPTSYPSTTDDDAIIEWNDTIDVPGDETVDSISIANDGSEGGPTFQGVGETTTTITGSSVIISGANSERTIVTATAAARIKTN
ncbi:MAG: hypothetical protein C4547_01680 [Phycisphaerales bacterium]|nr:MAG: hypothetical protein C4547_01680 [Phycisphaerales bacterium]